MADMKVALQVYTIRDHFTDFDGFAAAMKKVGEIGYQYVELAGVGAVSYEDQKKVCDDNGLTIIGTHAGYGAFAEDLDAVVANHQLLGAEFAIIPGLPGELRTGEGYAQVAKQMSEWADQLAEQGLGFAYHNHHMEFQKFGDRLAMDILFEDSSPNVGSELDTYWVQYGGGSPVACIRKLSGRVPLLHLKDYAIIEHEPTFAEVGEGNLEWGDIFAAAQDAGTKYLGVEEDRCTRPSMESIAISFRNLQAMGMC